MGRFRKPIDRQVRMLLPPSVDEYVDSNDKVRFVDEIVDALDLGEIEEHYSDHGRPAYSPQVLVKLLVYGRLQGRRSGRELADAARVDLRFMWLLGGERPDFRTICRFRKDFAPQLGDLLKQTIAIGIRENVIQLDRVAIDGTIVRASAGSRSFRTREGLQRELDRLELSFEPDVEADAAEESKAEDQDDDDDPDHTLPDHLRNQQHRVHQIRKAVEEMDKAKAEGRRLKQASTTDPDCRFIQSRSGRNPAYNAQAAVDITSGMIVGAYVTNDVSDGAQLEPMLEQIEENTGSNPDTVLADRGYNGLEGLEALEERGIDGRIPPIKQRSDVFGPERFEYDEATDSYRCPDRRTLRREGYDKKHRRTSYVCADCSDCSLSEACLGTIGKRRTLTVADLYPLKVAMAQKMTEPEIAASYSERAASIEPVFGNIKENRGMRSFRVRGLDRVTHDWRFESLVTNIQKLMGTLLPTTSNTAPATS